MSGDQAMAQISVKDWGNKELRSIDLDPQVFDYPAKEHLVYEAVCAYRAAGRAGTHKVKNRQEVSGGTHKLWKQKGTGRARVGDNRSPLWRHGATVHGPRPRSYSWKLPRKMRRNALRSLLSEKLRNGELFCLDNLSIDSPKTKGLETRVRDGLGLPKKTLLVPLDTVNELSLAARNNPRLRVVRALGLSVIDLLEHDAVVVSEEALLKLNEVLAP